MSNNTRAGAGAGNNNSTNLTSLGLGTRPARGRSTSRRPKATDPTDPLVFINKELQELLKRNTPIEGLMVSNLIKTIKTIIEKSKDPEKSKILLTPAGKRLRIQLLKQMLEEGKLDKIIAANKTIKNKRESSRGTSVGLRTASASRTRKPKTDSMEKFESDLRAVVGEKIKDKKGAPARVGIQGMRYAKEYLRPEYPNPYDIPDAKLHELKEKNYAASAKGAETRRSASMATKLGVNKAELGALETIRKSLEKKFGDRVVKDPKVLTKLRNAIGSKPIEGAIGRIIGNAKGKEAFNKVKEFLQKGASPGTRKRRYEECVAKCTKEYPPIAGTGAGAGAE